MTNKVVYTVITGNNPDHILREPTHRNDGWSHYCFTDRPNMERRGSAWKVIKISNPEKYSSVVLSRKPKILSHMYVPDAEVSLYLDCRFVIRERLDALLDESFESQETEIALMKHNKRGCVYDEASVLGLENSPMIHKYATDGMPKNWGLWAPGIMLRKHTERMRQFNEAWWAQFEWSKTGRDEIPLAYCFWKIPMGILELPFRGTYDRFMDKENRIEKPGTDNDPSHCSGNKSDSVPVQPEPMEAVRRGRGRPRKQ
jgi:hypothetical protein